jgi:hypothetical protein
LNCNGCPARLTSESLTSGKKMLTQDERQFSIPPGAMAEEQAAVHREQPPGRSHPRGQPNLRAGTPGRRVGHASGSTTERSCPDCRGPLAARLAVELRSDVGRKGRRPRGPEIRGVRGPAREDVHGLRRFQLAICTPVLHLRGWVGWPSECGRFVQKGPSVGVGAGAELPPSPPDVY